MRDSAYDVCRRPFWQVSFVHYLIQEGTPMGERYRTAAEVAAELRIGLNTVYTLVRAGKLRAVRIGRTVRIPESAVEDYLRRVTAGPAEVGT